MISFRFMKRRPFKMPTRTRADLDIAIVKVRLIESIELAINVSKRLTIGVRFDGNNYVAAVAFRRGAAMLSLRPSLTGKVLKRSWS
jgi:hypothetical protein